jgi:hypothetical protein
MVRTLSHHGDLLRDNPQIVESKVFEPSTFEIRFQYLSKVTERCDRDILVPTTVLEPSVEDGQGWVQSVFVFLCFVFRTKREIDCL